MRKCKECKEKYTHSFALQTTCSTECAIAYAKKTPAKQLDKLAKQYLKAQKVKAITKVEAARKAQAAFNAYIRMVRDADLPCISCQRFHQGQYHAGHYFTVGARPELRFCELNVHKQCSACNNHLSGNIALYRVHLLEKIGQEALAWLEGPHEPAKLSVDELLDLAKEYRLKLKALSPTQPA